MVEELAKKEISNMERKYFLSEGFDECRGVC